jgi:DNA-binding transcriptional LysR family regulator
MRREDLGSLAMFLAVADERNFTRAAARLGVSQSALSHSMRRLEAKLGLRLLTRTTRSVAPTMAGERLLETLRPALEEIDAKLSSLTELRERPAGTIRITTSQHAARTILWPVIDRLTAANPDIEVELNIDSGLTDIVAERFDAGVRLGERLEKDMIAVRIGPKLRMAAVGSPAYFAAHGVPLTPGDLARHRCINLRFVSAGSLYVWEFEKAGRALKVGGRAIGTQRCRSHGRCGDRRPWHRLHDRGSCCVAHRGGHARARVLDDWCEPFDGHHLYYPSRRQPSPAFSLLLEALRYRE